ncbi:aromatic amino acid transaminase [Sphingomonas sp. ac-8]|uniref:amino acid aminotransferase n=1 Tax=Sphingomonas sp. ac-8 TaxID=3242977 RepID=UPI003A802CCC
MTFETLTLLPADPLLALIGAYRDDPRPSKLDLGVGVFRDATGGTPVVRAVKAAEERLLGSQDSKSYLGPEGDAGFVAALAPLVLGGAVAAERVAGVQTPGGTGALRLGAELLAQAGVTRIWIATPSWPNHAPIFTAAGLSPQPFDAYDVADQRLDGDALLAALDRAAPGDAVLLHGCCHNPTGIDPDAALWTAIAERIEARGLVPFVDLAYQGLGDGWDADAAGARTVLAGCRYGLLAYSCDKNFALYRERTGALWTVAPDAPASAILYSNLLALARANWSMPPDHGAAAARIVLQDPALAADWQRELDAMRQRLRTLRQTLSALGTIGRIDLAPIARGKGMFATLPLSRTQVAWLREQHAVYMAASGRINIAGFDEAGIARFGEALAALDHAGVA